MQNEDALSIQKVKIIRRNRGFVQIDNSVVRDIRISLRARGALAYLLSQPDEFNLDIDQWALENREGDPAYLGGREHNSDLREGRDAIRAAMRELKSVGYVNRYQERQSDGTFIWVLTVSEDAVIHSDDNSEAQPSAAETPMVTTRKNVIKPQVAPQAAEPPAVHAPIYKNTNKERNTEYCRSGQSSLDKRAAIEKGLGCKACDEIGVIELDSGWTQCLSCRGSGIDQSEKVYS